MGLLSRLQNACVSPQCRCRTAPSTLYVNQYKSSDHNRGSARFQSEDFRYFSIDRGKKYDGRKPGWNWEAEPRRISGASEGTSGKPTYYTSKAAIFKVRVEVYRINRGDLIIECEVNPFNWNRPSRSDWGGNFDGEVRITVGIRVLEEQQI